jgi:predicted dehydrogenase
MDMGSHAVHLARTLFGPVTRVWASIRNESGIYPEVDDYGIAHLEFASGVSGVVEGGWTQTRPVREIEIVGSAATAWQNGDHMVFGAPGKDAQRVPLGESKPTRMDRLIAVIRGEIPSDELAADLAATTDTVAIMEACYTSAHSCKWTPVAI